MKTQISTAHQADTSHVSPPRVWCRPTSQSPHPPPCDRLHPLLDRRQALQLTILTLSSPIAIATSTSAMTPEAELSSLEVYAGPAAASVVAIGTSAPPNSSFTALASGIIYNGTYIITSYSAINPFLRQSTPLELLLLSADSTQRFFTPITSVVAREPSLDLIILQADLNINTETDSSNSNNSSAISSATFTPSSSLLVGQEVSLIGSLPDGRRSISTGVLSATNRAIPAPNNQLIKNMLQFDTDVPPLGVGGALVDSHGHVIGIPTTNSYSTTAATTRLRSNGVNFAVSSDTLIDTIPRLIAYGNLSGKR